jgi:hypothetical protein
MKLKLQIIAWKIFLVLSGLILNACKQGELPEYIIGNWEGTESVSTRYLDNSNQFIFVNDSLPVSMTIQNNRIVTGYIGNVKFIKCIVRNNNGWLGKKFHIGTETVIDGFLSGKFNIHDKYQVKIIKMPFNIDDSTLNGTLFMNNYAEMLPIIYHLNLKRKI